MTTKEFLLEKEINWARIEEMREETNRNQKPTRDKFNSKLRQLGIVD